MSYMKPIVVSTLIACVLSGIVAASGSANQYFIEGVAIKAAETFTAESSAVTIEATMTGGMNTIKGLVFCEKSKTTGEIKEKGEGKGTTTFEGCELYETAGAAHKQELLPNCTVANVKFEFKSLLEERNGVMGATTALKPAKAEETYADVEVTGGTCQVPGTYMLKAANGTSPEKCTNDESYMGVVAHLFVCSGVANTLKLATQPATFHIVTKEIILTGKKIWYME